MVDRMKMPARRLFKTNLGVYCFLEKIFGSVGEVDVDHLALVQFELLYTTYVNIILPASERIFRLFIRSYNSLSCELMLVWILV